MTYHSFEEWFALARDNGLSAAAVALQAEQTLTGQTEEEIYVRLAERWTVMRSAAEKALEKPQPLPGGLIEGQAACQNAYAPRGGLLGERLNHAMALALSCSEVNASMGRICAAPTAGACGILPAVLLTAAAATGAEDQELLDALLVAAGVGGLITTNATVSGAEGGCQAECGAAAAMGAAAAVMLSGGSLEAMGSAVSIALMNCMGLICDPVAGLVQLPCSFRNASQTINALLSADLALAGQDSVIPPDDAVDAMYRVGRQLPTTLRETAQGGVAATRTGRALAQSLGGSFNKIEL